MNKVATTFDLQDTNILDVLQIDLIHRLTEFSRLVKSKAPRKTLVKKAEYLTIKLDEVHGIYEAIVKET